MNSKISVIVGSVLAIIVGSVLALANTATEPVAKLSSHSGRLLLIDVGPVQPKSGDYGWGFMVQDSTRLHWITLTYRTEAEAKAAREQIKAATANVINASIE
jgi:hypothetical protein